jgi:hypothetical protein
MNYFVSVGFFILQVHLTLTETDTIWLLDLPGTYVAEDNESAEEDKEKNQKYEEVRKSIQQEIEKKILLFNLYYYV